LILILGLGHDNSPAVNRLIGVSGTAARASSTLTRPPWSTTGTSLTGRCGTWLAAQRLDHAVRLQSGVGVSQVAHGDLEPGGHLVLALKAAGHGGTNADVAEITGRLRQIENFLSASQPGDRSARL